MSCCPANQYEINGMAQQVGWATEPVDLLVPELIAYTNPESVSNYLTINALDNPDENGTHRKYAMSYQPDNAPGLRVTVLTFKSASEQDLISGINEIALLEIVKHRLQSNPTLVEKLEEIILTLDPLS